MTEPGREAVAGVVPHRPQFGRCSQGLGYPFGGPLVVGREGDPDMAVVEDRIVRPVGFLDLVEALGDEEGLQPIARHEGQGGFEEVETTERRELVEKHEQAAPPCPRL
ncbi:hypothetical protein D3C80_1240930 [compost metagenome]